MADYSEYCEQRLKQYFIEQILSVGYAKISITSLTAAAKINRTAFYQYYSSKADLAEHICSSFLDEFNRILAMSVPPLSGREELRGRVIVAFEHVRSEADTIRALWAINEPAFSPYLLMQQSMKDTVLSCISASSASPSLEQEMFAANFAASSMATIRYFLKHDCKNIERIADNVCTCIFEGESKLIM